MTKKQALEIFHKRWASLMELDSRWETDMVAKQFAWGTFTDKLCTDGDITEKQYCTWSNPFK